MPGKRWNCNDNGRIRLELCAEQQYVSPTLSSNRKILKTTWTRPRSKHWHIIDYTLVRQRDLKDVFHTRVMPSAECHTDHRLVSRKLRFHFMHKSRLACTPKKKLKIFCLETIKVRMDVQENIYIYIWSKLERSNCPANSPPDVL